MGAPIRSQEAIDTIINNGQHAIADLGLELIRDAKRGIDNTDYEFRQKQLRLILLRIYLQNMLDEDGNIIAYYQAAANEKKENNLLTGIAKLSGLFGGPAIPKLTGDNIPLIYYPSSNTYVNQSGEAVPGGITFENTDVDAPGEVIDSIDASTSTYAFYIINVSGTGVGEGSRGTILLVTWRGSNTPMVTEYSGGDVGGTTTGVSFSAALDGGLIKLTCNVPSNNWVVRGSRISFYNISFQNIPASLPTGGALNQLLRKASTQDYDFEFFTLVLASITDITATAAELNFSSGVTSGIQGQINALSAALANYLLLTGGTMSGAIAMGNNKITGLGAATANGDALRYEQLVGVYLLLTGGTMSGAIAMGNNKITGLAAATVNGDAVRFEQLPATPAVTPVMVEIGDWNMDTTLNVDITHGVDPKKIRGIDVIIRDDSDQNYDKLEFGATGTGELQGWVELIRTSGLTTSLRLRRLTGGYFDTTAYDATSYNRGWVTIQIAP